MVQNSASRRRQPARRRPWPLAFLGFVFLCFADLVRFVLYVTLFFALLGLGSYWVTYTWVRGESILVPRLTGLSVTQAMIKLHDDRISLQLESQQPHPTLPEGTIISQHPLPGSRIKKGTPLRVTLSSGPALTTVPDLRGQTRYEAGPRLRSMNLELGHITVVPASGTEGGVVLATDPPGGTGVMQNTKINLMISSGENMATQMMPNLYGMTLPMAREVLAQYGLVLSTERKAPNDMVRAGQIHDQYPAARTAITRETRVSVTYAPEYPLEQEAPAEAEGQETGRQNPPLQADQTDTESAQTEEYTPPAVQFDFDAR